MLQSILNKCVIKMPLQITPLTCGQEIENLTQLMPQRQVLALAKLEKRLECNPGTLGIAANETARVWGDPHFEDPDGGKFDVQGEAGKTYNLLSDSNLQFSGRFDGVGNGITVVGETGLSVTGPRGISQVQFSKEGRALLNGQALTAGSMETLADGGHALLSEDGKTLTLKTAEGYTITQKVNPDGLDIRVKTPLLGVATDGRMPSGLIGHTFDADKQARNSSDKQGQGAIDGNVKNYEVPALFPEQNNLPESSQNIVEQTLDFMLQQNSRQQNLKDLQDKLDKNKKLEALMLALLQSGNIDLAMLVFAQLESNEAQQMVGALTQQLQQAQAKRRELSGQMGQIQQGQQNSQAQLSNLQTGLQEVGDTLQMLTTLIKDVNDQKNRTIEFANNFLNAEHQTTMSVVRGMRG